MSKTYYVLTYKATGESIRISGVSSAPHLYRTRGIAEGKRKQMWKPDEYEVVPVQLTVIKEEK